MCGGWCSRAIAAFDINRIIRMKLYRCVICALASTLLAMSLNAAPERTVSTSRQFIVYGTDLALRGAVSHLAEDTKENLLRILRRSDAWETPIVVHLQFPQANLPEIPAAALHFSQTGAGLKLQLDLTIAADFSSAAIEREVLRATLLEIIYRKQPQIAPGTAYVNPPEWLLDGILAMAPGRDPKAFTDALEPVIRGNKLASFAEFFAEQPALLDSAGHALYRTYSFVLLRWIVDLDEGRSRLGQYIDNLHRASAGPLADLRAAFPELGHGGMEEGWKSRVAQLSTTQSFQLLTFTQTERRLAELLALKLADPAAPPAKTAQLQDFVSRRISAKETRALKELSEALMLLNLRAHPVLRPMIAEYHQISALLAAGKKSGINDRLARVRTLQSKLAARMTRIDDYMNWFEATQARTASGAFASYLNAVEERGGAPRRHDALSVYLDSLEEQFQD